VTVETISEAIGGREFGATWMTRCAGHKGLSRPVRRQRWGSARQRLLNLGVTPIVAATGASPRAAGDGQ
jgi:hypothetical protein